MFFLFGKEAKRSLSQLANFGIVQSFVKDIGNDSISNNEANEPVGRFQF